VFEQHWRQPMPGQHVVPLWHALTYSQRPCVHCTVWHGSMVGAQSAGDWHWVVGTQPTSGSQRWPVGQSPAMGSYWQPVGVQSLRMHARVGQSFVTQHADEPQSAVPFERSQHCVLPAWQRASVVHSPLRQTLGLHGSSFGPWHCESAQQAAHPSAQQYSPWPHDACSQSPPSHVSVVQGLPSSQSLGPEHCSRSLQPVSLQYCVSGFGHAARVGTWLQNPAKQSSAVQSEASAQSAGVQHWPQTPPAQQNSSSPHFGGFSQTPSSLQTSSVHALPSSHSDASVHEIVPPPPVPPTAAAPAVPALPPVPPDGTPPSPAVAPESASP
jgi:hypothetical protein